MTKAAYESTPDVSERTIPLTIALKYIQNPSKFLPELQKLRSSGPGFSPVHVERNLMILRQSRPMRPFSLDTVKSFEMGSQSTEVNGDDIPKSVSVGPKAKRLEPVFSGRQNAKEPWLGKQFKKQRHEAGQRRKYRFKRAAKMTAATVGVVVAGIYVAGVGAEISKGRKVVIKGD